MTDPGFKPRDLGLASPCSPTWNWCSTLCFFCSGFTSQDISVSHHRHAHLLSRSNQTVSSSVCRSCEGLRPVWDRDGPISVKCVIYCWKMPWHQIRTLSPDLPEHLLWLPSIIWILRVFVRQSDMSAPQDGACRVCPSPAGLLTGPGWQPQVVDFSCWIVRVNTALSSIMA